MIFKNISRAYASLIKIVTLVLLCTSVLLNISACSDETDAKKTGRDQEKALILFGAEIYPPFLYFGPDGQLTGFDYDVAAEACRRMGYTFDFKLINWADKKKLLADGSVDAIMSCFSMDGRLQDYFCVGPYILSDQKIMVKKDGNIKKLSDLNGKTLCVQNTTKPDLFFSNMENEVTKPTPHLKELLSFSSTEEAFSAFLQNGCDAVAAHEAILAALARERRDLVFIDEPLLQVKIGVAFFKAGDHALGYAMQDALNTMIKDGFIKETLQKYHMNNAIPSL